jgi:hypothetical protein
MIMHATDGQHPFHIQRASQAATVRDMTSHLKVGLLKQDLHSPTCSQAFGWLVGDLEPILQDGLWEIRGRIGGQPEPALK